MVPTPVGAPSPAAGRDRGVIAEIQAVGRGRMAGQRHDPQDRGGALLDVDALGTEPRKGLRSELAGWLVTVDDNFDLGS